MVHFLHFLIHYLIKNIRYGNLHTESDALIVHLLWRSSRGAVRTWILSPSDPRGASWCWNRQRAVDAKSERMTKLQLKLQLCDVRLNRRSSSLSREFTASGVTKEHGCFPLICWRCRYVQMHVVLIHVTLAPDGHFEVPHKRREVTSFHHHPATLITSQEVKRGNTRRPTVLHIRTSVISEGGGFMLNKYPFSFCEFCFHGNTMCEIRSCHALNQYLCLS